MTNLSPELHRLVVARRAANQPTEADRDRVFAELQARLGLAAGAGLATTGELSRNSLRTLAIKTAGIAAAAVAILAGGVALMQARTRASVPPSVDFSNAPTVSTIHTTGAATTAEPPNVQAPVPTEESQQQVADQPKPTATAGPSRTTSRPRDNLSEEVAILSSAQAELHSGRAENALRLLAEHERKYRRGILAEERTAAKIQALCALGRVTEANALLGKLSPQSLTGESARQACSSSKKPSPVR